LIFGEQGRYAINKTFWYRIQIRRETGDLSLFAT